MKKLLLLVVAFAIFSCEKEPKIDYALFSGKIENPKEDKIVVFGNNFEKEIKLNDDGTFADTLRVDRGYYSLDHGRERTYFFVAPSDDLVITLDSNKFDETISYEGTGANNNNYLAAKILAKENINFQEIYVNEEADFLKTIKETRTKAEDALKNAKELSPEFIALENKNINYDYLSNLARYPTYHPYYAKKENFEPSKDFLVELDKVDYDNTEDFANFVSYKELAIGHYMSSIYKDSLLIENVAALKDLKSQNIKNELASELVYFMSPSNTNAEKLYTNLMEISDDEDFKKELSSKYAKIKNLVA